MAKFTFKKDSKPTGLASVGHTPGAAIKYKKKVVGRIGAPQWHDKSGLYSVSFVVLKTEEELMEEPNCLWKWVTLSVKFDSEEQAREYLSGLNADHTVDKLQIVSYEDY